MNRQNLKILDVYLSVATNSVYFIKFKNNHDMVAVNMEFVFDCSLPQVIWVEHEESFHIYVRSL